MTVANRAGNLSIRPAAERLQGAAAAEEAEASRGSLDYVIRNAPQRVRVHGFGCKSSGRRRFQRPSKHVTEWLGRPAAKALDVAAHDVERTRREARLDADDGVDDLHRQTRLR